MKGKQLLEKFNNKSAVIAIIGLGYVGLPLALCYVEAGFKNVIGIDLDKEKIVKITNGQSYIKYIEPAVIKNAVENGFTATDDFSKIALADAIILCVPTPLNKYREPDISFIVNSTESLLPFIKENQILSLESTTYPGTTEEEILTRIEKQGFKVGENYYLVYSPEREDPGNPKFKTKTIPKVIGGATKKCLEVGEALYNNAIDTIIKVSSLKAAEMSKLLENIHRAVNIGLVNEMKLVADKMGIDIYEVIDAAATKPFGFTPYYPGPGLGGHCIPIDPFYLTWKAREYGIHTHFIELAGEINSSMPEYVISKVSLALNKIRKSIFGSKILIIGIAYKKNIDDCRESPSIELMELLDKLGAELSYHDNYFPTFPKMRQHHFNMKSLELTSDTIKQFDAILLATDHDYINYEELLENSKIIIDCRGRYRNIKSDKIVMA